jgi:hypothetical protein
MQSDSNTTPEQLQGQMQQDMMILQQHREEQRLQQSLMMRLQQLQQQRLQQQSLQQQSLQQQQQQNMSPRQLLQVQQAQQHALQRARLHIQNNGIPQYWDRFAYEQALAQRFYQAEQQNLY